MLIIRSKQEAKDWVPLLDVVPWRESDNDLGGWTAILKAASSRFGLLRVSFGEDASWKSCRSRSAEALTIVETCLRRASVYDEIKNENFEQCPSLVGQTKSPIPPVRHHLCQWSPRYRCYVSE